jgi:hypothetical protein
MVTTLVCRDCGAGFALSEAEERVRQDPDRKFVPPARCPRCRVDRWWRSESLAGVVVGEHKGAFFVEVVMAGRRRQKYYVSKTLATAGGQKLSIGDCVTVRVDPDATATPGTCPRALDCQRAP